MTSLDRPGHPGHQNHTGHQLANSGNSGLRPGFTTALHYTLQPVNPHAHLFEIKLTIAKPASDCQRLDLPAWLPGSYLVRDFAKNIVRISAIAGTQPIKIEQTSQHSWQVRDCFEPLTVTILVHAFDTSVRTAFLDGQRGFFNGSSVFLRAAGFEHKPCTLKVLPPPGLDHWQLATTMPRVRGDTDPWAFGSFQAADYDTLIDHPMEMGVFEVKSFESGLDGEVPHAFVMAGRYRADLNRLADDSAKICAEHARMFGACPTERYLFLTQVVTSGYGGLEHLDSSALVTERSALPVPGRDQQGDGYTTFLGLVSHEYFHLWNVKRICPEVVANSTLTTPAEFEDLWAYEGITSYYDDLALTRSGVIDDAAYLDLLAKQMTRLERNSGRHGQSLTLSSFTAWTKFYQQDANAANAIVSYYNKGAIVAAALDLTIRLESDGAYSLDDVMRAMWSRYGASRVPVPDRQIEQVAQEITGLDLAEFVARYIDGVEDPPLPQLLAQFGVRAVQRPRVNDSDAGGRAAAHMTPPQVSLGFELVPGGTQVRRVDADSPAQQAGLAPGDTLVAVNQIKANPDVLSDLLARMSVDDCVELHVFRAGVLHHLPMYARPALADTWSLTLDDDAGDAALQRRAAWLAASTAG